MKIAHISDTHLGYSAYGKVDEDSGLNQRETDTYRAFEAFVDSVVDRKPDMVLHSGDLFDSVRPTNRAISVALDQLLRLTAEGIPVVVIAGNHSTPRLRETGSVFRIFDHLEEVYPVYRGRYESIEIGEVTVHALPHAEGELLQEGLKSMEPSPQTEFNVAMMHTGIVGLDVFRMHEFNEQLINSSYLKRGFDYIALGHYHGHTEVSDNACYAGSTERFSFAEVGQEKGFLWVDLESGEWEFESLPTREMVDIGPIDASHMEGRAVQGKIEERLERMDLASKIVRLKVKNISSPAYQSLDFNRINQLVKDTVHFERRFDVEREDNSVQWRSTTLESIEEEFKNFLDQYPVEGVDKDTIEERGLEYLKKELEY